MSIRSEAITDDLLEDAILGGLSCRAMAWVEVTHIDVLEKKGKAKALAGLRTWRGRAILEGEVQKDRWYNHAVAYTGKLKDGDEVYLISADVFITSMRRYKRRVSPASSAAEPPKLYVEFTGGGGLPLRRRGMA